jgi:hypothetical protein
LVIDTEDRSKPKAIRTDAMRAAAAAYQRERYAKNSAEIRAKRMAKKWEKRVELDAARLEMLFLHSDIATLSAMLKGWEERDRSIPRPYLEQALFKVSDAQVQLDAAKARLKELLLKADAK